MSGGDELPIVRERRSSDGSLAVFGRWVLAEQDSVPAVLRDRWVVIEDGQISRLDAQRPSGVDRLIERPGCFVLPGLLNLHNHLFSEMIVRNRTEDEASGDETALVYGLLMPMSRMALERTTRAQRLAVSRLGLLQVLRGGSTTLMEPFRNTLPELFEAADEMGIRFYGAPYCFGGDNPVGRPDGSIDYGTGAGDGGAADLAEWDRLHATWEGAADGRIRLALSPHATDTCGPDLLRAVRARATETGAPVTIHVAQGQGELAAIRDRYGRTPTEYLDWVGLLGPDLIAAHCIFSTDADLSLMRRAGATVASCPRTFARAGIAAAFGRFSDAGLRTVVATDGYDMDLVGELGYAGVVSKLMAGSGTVATAGALLRAVTGDAAAAIGRADLGAIRAGASADLTVLDLSAPHLQPVADPIRAVVWHANRGDVVTLIVDGAVLIEDGRYLGDETAIVADGVDALEAVWALPEAQALFGKA